MVNNEIHMQLHITYKALYTTYQNAINRSYTSVVGVTFQRLLIDNDIVNINYINLLDSQTINKIIIYSYNFVTAHSYRVYPIYKDFKMFIEHPQQYPAINIEEAFPLNEILYLDTICKTFSSISLKLLDILSNADPKCKKAIDQLEHLNPITLETLFKDDHLTMTLLGLNYGEQLKNRTIRNYCKELYMQYKDNIIKNDV